MATPTYTPIESKTLGSDTSSITFTSIPQTYTDLVLVINGKSSSSTVNVYAQIGNNSYDTGTNYSWTWLGGSGSTAASGRASTTDALLLGACGTSSFSPTIINFQNYSNTTTYKTILSRSSTADTTSGQTVSAWVGLWRSTSAINQIKVYPNVQNWVTGTTATLYGIANSDIGAPKATGGIITYDSTYYYHTFGASGTFTPQQSLTADILVVAGGGGAGRIITGGGGAGGLLGFASQSLSATSYTVTVGAGGAGRTANSYGAGSNGGDSQFGALTLVKGGGTTNFISAGSTGGSGGGASGGGGTLSGGSATSGQGSAGGAVTISTNCSAGGGGAGGVGSSPTSTSGGAGGVGLSTYSSWGLATGTGENVSGTVYYAGGGGGAASASGATSSNAGQGGYGGGGKGGWTNAPSTDNTGTAGLANTGGGGGAAANDYTGYNSNNYGQNGGSGVVIIRYLKA